MTSSEHLDNEVLETVDPPMRVKGGCGSNR